MMKYEVVKESHAFGDEKVEIEVLQERDVRGWISQQLSPVKDAIEGIGNLLQTKIDRVALEKFQTDINSSLDKNLTAVEQHIRKLPDICEQDFKKIIEKNITPQLESFAQQIERGEKHLQEVKATLADAENTKLDCELVADKCAKINADFKENLRQMVSAQKDAMETLRKITEQADLVKKMRDEMISMHESYIREMSSLRESIYEPRGIFKFLFKKAKQPAKLNSEKQEETNNVN